jgi:hypothetical protein
LVHNRYRGISASNLLNSIAPRPRKDESFM